MANTMFRVSFEKPGFFVDVSAEKIVVEMEGAEICALTPYAAVEKITRLGDPRDWTEEKDIDGEVAFAHTCENGVRSFTWTTASNNWQKKEYVLECDAKGFNYFVRVYGEGAVGDISYFKVNRADGSQKLSQYGFKSYYVPTTDSFGKEYNYYTSGQPYKSYFELMVPPMYCYAFQTVDVKAWMGMGLMAKPGNYNFMKYDYVLSNYEFCLSTNMEGHTQVNGMWEAPFIRVFMGNDEYDVIDAYAAYHYDAGLVKGWNPPVKPRWWMGPIFCSWCEQANMAARAGKASLQMAAQQPLEEMVALLDKRGMKPSFIIVDDKWQKEYGTAYPNPEQWPDMRAFIDKMHARGIKVLLWFRLWGGEGLPMDETMPGGPVQPWNKNEDERYADPSNPKYQKHLQQIIHTLLSDDEGCMNADGFKLDFAFWMPHGRRAVSSNGQYGTELLKTLFTNIYNFAKQAKPEALINGSPCHPYFCETLDQIRLHDYDDNRRNAMEVMGARQRLYTTAMRGQSVDTDNTGFANRRQSMNYLLNSVKLGIPVLYHISPDKDHPAAAVRFTITDEDWEAVRKVWEDYNAKIDREYNL